jgi:hypothetical protein
MGNKCLPVYFNGAEGDLSVGHKSNLSAAGVISPFRTFERASEIGTRLANIILDAVESLTREDPVLSIAHRMVALPLKTYPPLAEMKRIRETAAMVLRKKEEALAAGHVDEQSMISFRLNYLFARIEEYYANLYEKEQGGLSGGLQIELSVLRIGNTAVVSWPGEASVEIATSVRLKSLFERTMFLGLANDYIGYIPTAEQAALLGYEVVASRVKPEASKVLESAAIALLRECNDIVS